MISKLERILAGGLVISMLIINPPTINAGYQGPQSKVFSNEYSTQQPDDKQYSMQVIEREKRFKVDDKGDIQQTIEDDQSSDVPKPEPPTFVGNPNELNQHYTSLRKSGNIPDLNYLEDELKKIADGMMQNPRYLVSNGFDFPKPFSDGRRLIFAAGKWLNINGINYKVLINADGRYNGENILLEGRVRYQIASPRERELRESQENFELWHAPKSIEGSVMTQRRIEIWGKKVYDSNLNNLYYNMKNGLLSQQLTRRDIK